MELSEDFSEGEPQKKKLKMKRCTQQRRFTQEKTKMQRKVNCSLEQDKISSIWYSTAAQSQFAALIPENIKLVYLRKRLVLEMIKQPESVETKIVGSFIRVKLDPHDSKQRNSHMLVQITGIKHGSSDECNSESLIQVSNMARDVCLDMLSDGDISEDECHELRKKVKAGLLKKLTIVELEQRAKILHEDITKHRIARELNSLQNRIDRANEKGWRQEVFHHLQKRKLLVQPSYLSFELQNFPRVIPEEVELEALDGNDNQMHRCSDETTPAKQNIPGVTPEKVELEPLSKDEKEVNQMHQYLDETTPTMRNIPGVIPKEVELEPLAEDEWDGYKMHQCADETTPTKKNILGVIPEEVELDPMIEDERDGNKMHQCADETTPTKKNILGVIHEEVELDPMIEDERDGNKMHQCADETTPTKKNILGVIAEEVELESLGKDKKDINQIHQCLDETTPTKKNILGVIPENVELESLAENEDDKLSSDNGDFSDGGPQKKRFKQQKRKMQRRVTSKKKEFVGWGSKSLIDFLRFIGHDTREKLSPYDVTLMVYKYVKDHNLIHPVEKRKILCDVQLEAIFGKKVVNRDRLFSLLESHFVENEERLQKEKKVEQNKRSSISYSTAAQSQFAALIPENIKLVYLKRSLVLEMFKKPESIETKIIGSFVRVKLDPRDFEQRNSYQLVQITASVSGIKHGPSDKCCCQSSIQVSNMAGNVCLTMLSDDEFSKEECDDLRKKVKAGLLKKLTIVELEQKAKILHEDITNHRIARERELALQNIPRVIPEEEEFESLDGNNNQMHRCSDETTPTKQNIPGVTPEKVELEPVSKDKKEVNQMHQCLDETTPTMRNIPGVIPKEVELELLAEDVWDGNKMHQWANETTPTKKNILGVIPEEVELDPMIEDERDGNKMHQCADETTPTKKNILGLIPEEVELDPMIEDERDGNKMHQCADETTPTKKNILGVIPEEVELDPMIEDERDGNKMHQCADETTPTKKNILGVIPEVELDPMIEDERDGNKMHQCADETTPTKKNILGVIREEVELDPMIEDERDGNKMHQCADETTHTKKNIHGVIAEEVELECLGKDKKDINQIHQCLDETTPTKKNILGVIPENVELESLAENEDDKLSSDNGDFSERGPLIDFLRFIGHDTREKLTSYDVTSMVYKYVKDHNLIHPVKKRKILCDIRLEAIFGKKVVNRNRVFSLLESHFVENEERLQKEKKVEQNKRSSISYSTAAQSQFATLIPENIKLVYLKRSLVLEMFKKPESIETKIIGSFVRVKLDPCDFEQRNSHQLVQITASVSGIKHGPSDKCCCQSLIQVSNMAGDVCLTMLSDDEFFKEECDDLRKKVKAGLLKKLTIVDLEQKAKILHEDITNHRFARELQLALQNIPRVIPEEEEFESLDGNDNQMQQCSMRQPHKEK